MKPGKGAAIAAALLATLQPERELYDRLQPLSEAVTDAGAPELALACWQAMAGVHAALVAIADATVAAEQAPAEPVPANLEGE